eukprot:759709-Hanusia_phi.AAC.2
MEKILKETKKRSEVARSFDREIPATWREVREKERTRLSEGRQRGRSCYGIHLDAEQEDTSLCYADGRLGNFEAPAAMVRTGEDREPMDSQRVLHGSQHTPPSGRRRVVEGKVRACGEGSQAFGFGHGSDWLHAERVGVAAWLDKIPVPGSGGARKEMEIRRGGGEERSILLRVAARPAVVSSAGHVAAVEAEDDVVSPRNLVRMAGRVNVPRGEAMCGEVKSLSRNDGRDEL